MYNVFCSLEQNTLFLTKMVRKCSVSQMWILGGIHKDQECESYNEKVILFTLI